MPEKLRILCVDDEPQILSTLERFCRNEGITMLRADSASAALDLLRRQPVHVVITDYQMPEGDGLAFLREVRTRWPRPVRIMLSGFIGGEVVATALKQGDIFGFLPKPWKRAELKSLLKSAADQLEETSL